MTDQAKPRVLTHSVATDKTRAANTHELSCDPVAPIRQDVQTRFALRASRGDVARGLMALDKLAHPSGIPDNRT